MSLRERSVNGAHRGCADDTASVTIACRNGKDSVKRHLYHLVIEDMGKELGLADSDDAVLRGRLEHKLEGLLDREAVPLSAADKREMVEDVVDGVLGYGPIQSLLEDPDITEIMVNNPETVYVERKGKILLTDRRFIDEAHLLRVIDRIVGQAGRRIDETSPMVDARLPNGSRVNAVVHPIAIDGSMLTISKPFQDGHTFDDLITLGTLTQPAARFLEVCVRKRLNILVSGGAGAGKTTLLNAIGSLVPGDERIVTIEDATELRLRQEHVLRLETSPLNTEPSREVTVRDLVRNSLRMRSDRIILGEVRGAEALDMLQAMGTGRQGCLSTVNANSPREAIARLETMALMAGFDLPLRTIREQVSWALDLIVHIARMSDGTRKILRITKVGGMEGEKVVLQDVFCFDHFTDPEEKGRLVGHSDVGR